VFFNTFKKGVTSEALLGESANFQIEDVKTCGFKINEQRAILALQTIQPILLSLNSGNNNKPVH
jgi:CRISPR/Cas system endoribonuclease Cas6 (RAMP superfamily)